MGPLTLTILLPLVGAVALAFVGPPGGADEGHAREGDAEPGGGHDPDRTAKVVGLAASLAALAASVVVAVRFDPSNPQLQLTETAAWIPSFGASFSLAVDGISLVLIVLTTFLTPLILVASWHQREQVRGYVAAFLVLEAAVIGVFAATDLVLFYVFFELSLVPMYLIIGVWGGAQRRYAAIKFFLYTFLGSLLMLVGILYLFGRAGSFAYADVVALSLPPDVQRWLFVAFFLAFAVKVPVFPVHTWLPDAHTEAPTGGSVFLAAVLLKLGGFGLLRYSLPLFPDATRELLPWLLGLAVVGILYGAVMALMQRDIKRLIAYSSVSHMGFVVLGIFAVNATATSAGVVQMLNHGLSTGALFLLVGFLYDRRHTRQIAAFGGLARSVPVMAGLWLVVSLSSLALPGLNGFVGEFPILLGAYQTSRWAAVLGSFGAVLAALYLLWAYQRMFHGPLDRVDNEHTVDLRPLEVGVLVPLVVLIVAIGIYPKPLFDTVQPSVERVLEGVTEVQPADAAGPIPVDEQ